MTFGLKTKLLGRRIRGVFLRPFPDGRGGEAYNPSLLLDDGARLTFSVQETESGEYGVTIDYQDPPTKR